MAHVESFYLDANLESDAATLPVTENDLMEAQFIADSPLNNDAITRIVGAQLKFERNSQVVSDYCVEAQQSMELENPNLVAMSSSILDNHKYFAPPQNTDASQYVWNPTDAVSSHHQYVAQSPNIYTNDYMTSEPSDYVYM
ncbi:hypothetical protein GCK72_002377 [Caenorhabditis remanei]|uniref:Uncharacterized protein n=1 Tax=Caenorhabditis remanei TaxID=31234 RepID=A0A6A5HRL9_CAERE|nr:hypothetical protein GCK72_002377 [Caenorhabditis remanei]KAF1770558.1 hypothetical protein GCK72_002377 [Caenorhabditis remanei]